MGVCASKHDYSLLESEKNIDQYDCMSARPMESQVLLLGDAGAGKTAMLKMLKMKDMAGPMCEAELAAYRPAVYQSVLESAYHVGKYMKEFGLQCAKPENVDVARQVMECPLDHDSTVQLESLPEVIVEIMCRLAKDPVFARIVEEYPVDLYSVSSAPYFFTHIERISAPGYIPNEMDAVLARQEHTNDDYQYISILTHGKKKFWNFYSTIPHRLGIYKIGSELVRSEAWAPPFNYVHSVIFCADLTAYDDVLEGDKKKTRLQESVEMYEAVINSPWFQGSSIVILFTKVDLFTKKLMKSPMDAYFPEYTGGTDPNKAAQYILDKFRMVKRPPRRPFSVYPFMVPLLHDDTFRTVFLAIRECILTNAFSALGMM